MPPNLATRSAPCLPSFVSPFGRDARRAEAAFFSPLGEMPEGQRGELLAMDVFGRCGPLCFALFRVSPRGGTKLCSLRSPIDSCDR